MERTERVDLAHVTSFALGRLMVLPAVHELVRDDGASEILQHRVMQVLVALARAEGAIVTRDELTMSCWDGRVVGEDAINRILSRLRAVASGIGAGSFRIETITRVGYRLLREGEGKGEGGAEAAIDIVRPLAATPARLGRRTMLAGGAAALATIGTAGWWLGRTGAGETPPPAAVASLMQQGMIALGQNTQEGQNQAIGLYRRVVALAPDYADGWGALGNAYALTATYRAVPESNALRARARAAGLRALALDPDNGFGQVAVATAVPARGHWLGVERVLRRAVAQHPDNEPLLFAFATLLALVGRNQEALPLVERMAQLVPARPGTYFFRIRLLWATNRLEEADRLMDEASAIFPTHFAIWFVRFYLLMYSGRAAAAIALAEDRDRLPTGIPRGDFEAVLRTARALDSRAPAEVAQVMTEQMARAREGAGYAENAMQFASAVGRLDDAFVLADAYYFGRGFTIPDIRFTREQGTYTPLRERITAHLFLPVTQPMRADPRFDALVAEFGLKRYWDESGVRPDYQRG